MLRPAHAALLCLALTAPLVAQSELRALRRAFSPKGSTAEQFERRQEALAGVAGQDSPQLAEALLRAHAILEHEAVPIEEKRIPLLWRGGGKSALGARLELARIRTLQERIEELFGDMRSAETCEALLDALLDRRRPPAFSLRLVLAKQVVQLGGRKLYELVKGVSKKRRGVEDRLVFLQIAASLGERGQVLGDYVLSELEAKEDELRYEAARTLATLAWPESLAPLIARIDKEEGRVQGRVVETLETLTGQTLGPSPVGWDAWLAAEGQAFLKGQKRLGRPKAGAARSRKKADSGYYFGLPQDGNGILYVVDYSQSMINRLRGGKQADTRIERTKQELEKALGQLREGQRFGIIAFGNPLWFFERELVPATKANVQRAQDWVRKQPLKFGTNSYDALELGFRFAGRGAADRYYEPLVDTMFFLSDGLPTVQKLRAAGVGPDDEKQILSGVRRWNALGRIRLHTIGLGLGTKRPRQFMQRLAEQNGGTFVRISK